RDVANARDVLVPGGAIDDLQVVLVRRDGGHGGGGVLHAVGVAAADPGPRGLAGGDRVGPRPAVGGGRLAGEVRARVVDVQVAQLRGSVQRGLGDVPAGDRP